MFTNVKYVIITALRDWLFSILIAAVLLVTLIANFLGNTALIENHEMGLAFASSVVRIIIITGIILFSCFHIRNAFDTKEIDVFLSRPITRKNLIISYWLALSVVAFLLVVPSVLLVALNTVLTWKGFFIWSGAFLFECVLVVAFSVFFAFTFNSTVTAVLASGCFYILTRMIGFFTALAEDDTGIHATLWQKTTMIFSLAVPRLDLYARSDLLIYGTANNEFIPLVSTQIAIFIPLIILLSTLHFSRRQF